MSGWSQPYAACHFAYGNVGCAIDWLRGVIEATPEELAFEMFACIPDELREAYAVRSAHEMRGAIGSVSVHSLGFAIYVRLTRRRRTVKLNGCQ